MYIIEYACECIETYGPNPDCGRCGGDGSIQKNISTLPKNYPKEDAIAECYIDCDDPNCPYIHERH